VIRASTHRALKSAILFILAYSPLFGAVNGTFANAQATQNTTYTYYYDYSGNVIQATDPLNRDSTYTYDALNRLKTSVMPRPSSSSEIPTVTYSYDGLDQVTTIKDPRSLLTNYTRDGLRDQTALASPDTGASGMSYDEAGNVTSSTDARGKLTRYRYDALDRLTNIDYASGTPSVFEYDGGAAATPTAYGRLSKLSDESGTTSYEYDGMGRTVAKVQSASLQTGALVLTVRYSYNNQGRVDSLTYPSGSRISYTYDMAGRVNSINFTPPANAGAGTASVLLNGIVYTSFGPARAWQWGSNASTPNNYVRSFDLDGRLISYPLGSMAGTEPGLLRTLNYDALGNIIAANHTGPSTAASLNQTYGYDAINRLTSFASNSSTQNYVYDTNNNRTSLLLGAASYPYAVSPTSNRLVSTSGPLPAKGNSYDAAGNLLNDGNIAYTYSDRGRLSSAVNGTVSVAYRYNAIGQRVSKLGASNAGDATVFAYDEEGRLLGEYDASGVPLLETVFLGDLPVAVLKSSSDGATPSAYYIYADQINTPRVIENPATGKAVWRWDAADPFGAARPDENPAGEGGFVYNPRFPGQVFDKETNNHYNYYRDYDPQTGGYIESDPVGLEGGITSYGYVSGNPLTRVDPQGLAVKVVVNGNNVTLTVPISYTGPGASPAVTSAWNTAISNTWTGTFGRYDVTTQVIQGSDNKIFVPSGDGRAYVDGLKMSSGVWPSLRPGWTAAHETGHLMGLPDEYTDTGGSNPGWADDIMGARNKGPSERDIAKIIARDRLSKGPKLPFHENKENCSR
jgi:RHS repeat-associated protein